MRLDGRKIAPTLFVAGATHRPPLLEMYPSSDLTEIRYFGRMAIDELHFTLFATYIHTYIPRAALSLPGRSVCSLLPGAPCPHLLVSASFRHPSPHNVPRSLPVLLLSKVGQAMSPLFFPHPSFGCVPRYGPCLMKYSKGLSVMFTTLQHASAVRRCSGCSSIDMTYKTIAPMHMQQE